MSGAFYHLVNISRRDHHIRQMLVGGRACNAVNDAVHINNSGNAHGDNGYSERVTGKLLAAVLNARARRYAAVGKLYGRAETGNVVAGKSIYHNYAGGLYFLADSLNKLRGLDSRILREHKVIGTERKNDLLWEKQQDF